MYNPSTQKVTALKEIPELVLSEERAIELWPELLPMVTELRALGAQVKISGVFTIEITKDEEAEHA